MRILAIRGANLASLTAFDIDLTREPLASAGLFAITGDTGAGKSTMLDALCLALYGEYPRTTGARGERDVDASGDALAIKDARNILRRGSATGFAEADFIGRDGVAYRARWETRRARQKASGKLQPVERALSRLDGSATVATGTMEVEAAVIDRTGLTFDQFRRTVLLAQGEFDAFLLADEKSRADLLEKITGTEVYSRISQAVHAETAKCADRIAHLETARGAVALLDPDQRTKLTIDAKAAEESAAAKEAERTIATAALERARLVAAARERLTDAERALADAHAADRAATDDRKRLAMLGRLAPISAKADDNREAQAAIEGAKASRAKAEAEMRAVQAVVATSAVSLQKANQAEKRAAEAFATAEPMLRQADALDVEINAARRELEAAEKAVGASQHENAGATQRLGAIAEDRERLAATLQRLDAELEASAGDAALAERGREISRLFMQRHDAAVKASNEQHETEQARAAVDKLVASQEQEQRTVKGATIRRAAISDQLKVLRAELNKTDTSEMEEQDRALAQLLDKAREAEVVASDWRQADTEILEARDAVVALKAALERADSERTSVDAELERRRAVRRELGNFAVLADATLSEAAERLRDSLETNQPCPVCGSKSHPFASHDGAGSKLAREIAGRRDNVEAEIEALQARLDAARETASQSRAQLDEMQRRTSNAHAEKARLAQAYAALARPLTAAMTACRLSFLVPAALDMRTSHTLAQIIQTASRARQQYDQSLSRRRELRAEIDKLQQEHEALARTREEADERNKEWTARRIEAERRLASAQSRAAEVVQVLDTFNEQLRPYLATIQVDTASLDVDTEVIETQLNERGALYLARRGERERIAARLQACDVEVAAIGAKVAAAGETSAAAAALLETRKAHVADLTARRSALLDGASTDERRAALAAERDAAQKLRMETAELQQKKALEFAIAIERQQQADQALVAAEARQKDTHAALAAAVGDLGIAWTEVEALMALPADAMVVLSDKIATLSRAVTDAETAVEMRRADLAQARAGATDANEDLAAIEARLAALTADIAALREQAAAARTKLALDEEARGKVGTLADEIDAARSDYAIRLAVDTAIGSATGDKFRRYAQGVTLDQLTELANLQLAALNPRYRLVRSKASDLGLSVIDRDMGEDLRAVRSLSGGERFLVSLALALALSSLDGRESFVDTLFIDEGFGALDADTLDTAIDALEMLHSQGRKVGVVTHVAAMIERIAVQVRVEKRGQGRSVVRTAA